LVNLCAIEMVSIARGSRRVFKEHPARSHHGQSGAGVGRCRFRWAEL